MTVSEAFRQLDWYFSADDGSAAEEKTKLAYRVLKECVGQMVGLKQVEARHKNRHMSITPHIYIKMLDEKRGDYTMKIHNFDGKQYIALGDFDWLCHNLIKDIYGKYEKDDDGYHLSDTDMGMVSAYSHIRVEVLADKLAEASDSATDAKSLRQNYDRVYSRLRHEWTNGKYAITATDKTQEKSETIYFSRYDDDDHPVFVGEDQKRKLLAFECYEHAAAVMSDLTEYAEGMDEAVSGLKVVPLRHIFTSGAEQRLLNAIFGDKEPPKQHWCIFLEPDEKNDRPSPMWFGEWLKHRPDQPQHILEWLESAGVKPGESAPMFCPADKGCMLFVHKGMAEKTAERIAKEYPEFDGKLHVMEYEEVDDEDT